LIQNHTEDVSVNELKESLFEDSFRQMTEDDLSCATTQAWNWPPMKLSLNGVRFFLEMVLKNKRYYIWVYY
jgi:hypothetical protein